MTQAVAAIKEAEIRWWGNSKEVLSAFPAEVKQNLGFALRQLQEGQEPADFRPLSSVDRGVFELRDQDASGWYRVVYLSRTNDVIHVLHAFSKKSRPIPKNDVQTARQNLKQVRAWILEGKKNAKRGK